MASSVPGARERYQIHFLYHKLFYYDIEKLSLKAYSLNTTAESIKYLEENIAEDICDVGLGKDMLAPFIIVIIINWTS